MRKPKLSRNALVIASRYKSGIMSRSEVLNYIESAMHPYFDAESIQYLKNIIK